MEQSSTAGSLARTATIGRTRQLMALLEALLPSRTDEPQLSRELEDLLGDGDGELANLRRLALASGRHEHSWCERCPTGATALGDYGVLADDSESFESVRVLGNIFEDGSSHILQRVKEVDDEIMTYRVEAAGKGDCVHFQTCGSDAWRYFMKHAPSLAQRHGVAVHSLLLVTLTRNVNDFQVTDWSAPPLPRPGMTHAIVHDHSPHAPHFGARTTHGFGHPFGNPIPTPNIVYLFTSGKQDAVPYLTDDPMGRPRPEPTRSTSWCSGCSSGWPVHYVNYIQLDPEDLIL
ncbi:unnamed protein product [Peniophora sp. CBMAI 1063]|nr:unnamed protein product [Peniophora sp. CBMAI 1063]